MMIWNFAFGKCHGRGALNRFLIVLILIETRAILIMKVSLGDNIFMRWVFNFCLFCIFILMVLACWCQILGGELSKKWFLLRALWLCYEYSLIFVVFVAQFLPRFLLFLLFGTAWHMFVQREGRIFSVLEVCSFLAARLCYCYLIFYYMVGQNRCWLYCYRKSWGGGGCDAMIFAAT